MTPKALAVILFMGIGGAAQVQVALAAADTIDTQITALTGSSFSGKMGRVQLNYIFKRSANNSLQVTVGTGYPGHWTYSFFEGGPPRTYNILKSTDDAYTWMFVGGDGHLVYLKPVGPDGCLVATYGGSPPTDFCPEKPQ